MANEELFAFNKRDGKRIAKSVRRTERLFEGSTSNPQPARRFSSPVILAKLQKEFSSRWDAIEVGFDGSGVGPGSGGLVELPNPRKWGTGEDELPRLRPTFDANSAAKGDIVVVFLKHSIRDFGATAQWYFGATTPTPIGCHLQFNLENGDLDVTVITLLGGNTTDPEEPNIQSKYLIFSEGEDEVFECLFLDVDCETLPPGLSGDGLTAQLPVIVDEPCKIMIDIDDTSCDALQVDEFGLSFDADPLAGPGLVNLFDCELSILIDPACNALSVGPLGLLLDLVLLAGDGLKEGAGPCELEVDIDKGIKFDGNQVVLGIDTLTNPAGFDPFASTFAYFEPISGNHHRIELDSAVEAFLLYAAGSDQVLGHVATGSVGWFDAGAGITFTASLIALDIFDLDTNATPSMTSDYFGFANNLDIDNEKCTLTNIFDVATSTVTAITSMRLDGSNNLQIKTTDFDVYNPQPETSSWTTVTGWTTSDCP